MFDVFMKFSDFSILVRSLIVAWIVFTAFIAIVMIFAKPITKVIDHNENMKQAKPIPSPTKPTTEDNTMTNQSKPTIIAPNSAISFDQKGGVNAHTVNVNLGPQARHIMQEQGNTVVSILKHHSGLTVPVTAIIGDKESAQYANEIISVLQDSGISVVTSRIGTMTPPAYGLIISSGANMGTIRDAFRSAKIDFTTGELPGPPLADSGIFVGLHP